MNLPEHTVQYIDKDRFIPWLDKEIENSLGITREKLKLIRHLALEGRWDWQPGE